MRADVLVGSALLHGAALALVVHWVPAAHAPAVPPTRVEREPPLVEAKEPPLIDVVVLDERASPAVAPVGRSAGVHRRERASTATHEPAFATSREPAAGDVARAATTGEPAAGAERAASSHPATAGDDLLHMRGPDLPLAPGAAERIAGGGPDLPSRAHESGKPQSAAGGGALIRDRVTTVVVERDGSAHFYDKRDIDLHWHVPIPHLDVHDDLRELGDALQDWYRDPYAATRYGTTSELSELAKAVPGACDTWGDPMCDDPLAPEAEKRERRKSNSVVSVGGAADVTAWLYRRYAHADPYASRKARLLDDTRAERVERGAAFRKEQAARSAELMQRTLEQLWAREPDPVARRRALYELWADCDDDVAGGRARAMVVGWIRAKLPAGSADAYGADELARMAPFAPYEAPAR